MYTTAILLAAGRNRGRQVPRPLKRRGGMTFLESAVEQALLSCADEVVVILGKRLAAAKDSLEPRPRLRVIVNHEHTEKRSRLLEAAFHVASKDATGFFIAYADDRGPQSPEIDQFLSVAMRTGKPLVMRDGLNRELLPMLIDRSLKSELLNDLDDETLRRVVERDASRLCLVRVGVDKIAPVRARAARVVRRRTRS
ncbi:MAG: NTP transferase domain-containing protein [Planctomycetota bacterium]